MSETYTVKVRPEKVEAVAEIAERLSRAEAVILTEYRGLTVGEIGQLRVELGSTDTEYKVVKNTLTRLAAQDRGIEGLDELLEGPTAVAFCFGDPVSGAKALSTFAKNHPALVIKGGVLNGKPLDAEGAEALANVDALDVSRAKIAGSLTSALSAIVGALEGSLRQLIYIFDNFPATAQAASAPAAESPAPEASAAEAEPEAAAAAPAEAEAAPAADEAGPEAAAEPASEGEAAAPDEGSAEQATETEEGE